MSRSGSRPSPNLPNASTTQAPISAEEAAVLAKSQETRTFLSPLQSSVPLTESNNERSQSQLPSGEAPIAAPVRPRVPSSGTIAAATAPGPTAIATFLDMVPSTDYRVGDILYAIRGKYYHHSGIVVQIGEELVVAHYGPGGEGEDLTLDAVLGTAPPILPSLLKGAEAVEKTFPKGTRIERTELTEDEKREIEGRVHASLDQQRSYNLLIANCQHYATEMRYGLEHRASLEVNAGLYAVRSAFQQGSASTVATLRHWMPLIMALRPFGSGSWWASAGNVTIQVLLVVFLLFFGVSTGVGIGILVGLTTFLELRDAMLDLRTGRQRSSSLDSDDDSNHSGV